MLKQLGSAWHFAHKEPERCKGTVHGQQNIQILPMRGEFTLWSLIQKMSLYVDIRLCSNKLQKKEFFQTPSFSGQSMYFYVL